MPVFVANGQLTKYLSFLKKKKKKTATRPLHLDSHWTTFFSNKFSEQKVNL